MSTKNLVFTAHMEPSPIYITQDASNPYINPTISLVFRCYDKSNEADIYSNLIPKHSAANSSYIDVYCIWEDDQKNLLCSLEEAKRVRIIKLQESQDWKAEWNSAGQCWRFFTPAVLEQEFMAVFGFDGLTSSMPQGMALLYATPTSITGLDTYAFSIGKRYPVSIRSFTAEPLYVFKGNDTTLRWDTANATNCKLLDQQVNTKDSKCYTVTKEREITLYAANAYNQERHETVTVALTNWINAGNTDLSCVYEFEHLEDYDLRLFLYEESLYFFADFKLYMSSDRGLSFQAITLDSHTIDVLKGIGSDYYTVLYNGSFFVIGNSNACICNLKSPAKEWRIIDCNLMLSTKKGGGAFLHRKKLYFAAIVNPSIIAIFAYSEAPTYNLHIVKSVNLKKIFGLDFQADALEVTVSGDLICIGISDSNTKTIHLFTTYDLDNWTSAAPLKKHTGWFRLLTCNDRAMLLTRHAMRNPLNLLETYPHFLPLLKDGKTFPIAGTVSGEEYDNIAVIAQREQKEALEQLWTFRTI